MIDTNDMVERMTVYSGFSKLVRSDGIEAAAREVAKTGAKTVEFLETAKRPVILDLETAKRYRKVLDAYGLSVACYSVLARLWEPGCSDGDIALQEERLLRLAEFASVVGSPFLHHTLAPTDDFATPYETVLDRVTAPAVRIAQYAESRFGIRVLYEPQGMYFNGNEGFRGLYTRVKAVCPYIGVCGDIGNPMFVDRDAVAFLEEFADDTLHVHVKDYRVCDSAKDRSRGGRGLLPVPIGTGDARVGECLDILYRSGYTGYFGVEQDYRSALIPARDAVRRAFTKN